MNVEAIQDTIPHNHCMGCGPDNQHGLRIKSYWCGDLESECTFHPERHMAAGPEGILNGGVIATLLDCHAVGTALAHARRLAGCRSGEGEDLWYATGSLEISYRRPTPIDHPVHLRAKIISISDRKTVVACTASSEGQVCAEATVVAVRVSPSWRNRERRVVPPPAQTLGGWKLRDQERRPLPKSA